MTPLRLAVLGTRASDPYAGMAWMRMQIAAGLLRLGHDVHYLETTSTWPYDPIWQTGFGTVFPTGEGLFGFNTTDEILAAFDATRSDYERHSRAAREIAAEYFRAETVLARLLDNSSL